MTSKCTHDLKVFVSHGSRVTGQLTDGSCGSRATQLWPTVSAGMLV